MASSGNKYGGTGTPTGAGALSAARAITQSAAGVPTHTAPKNTLYRNETSGILYINADGATTWVAVGSGTGTAGQPGRPGEDGRDGEDSYVPGPPGIKGDTGNAGADGRMGPPGWDAEPAEECGLWVPPGLGRPLLNRDLPNTEWALQSFVQTAFAESIPRWAVNTNGSLIASARLSSVAVPVRAGKLCANLSFCSGSVGLGTPTNWWFALCDASFVPMRQSTDQLATAWASAVTATLAQDSIPVTAGARVASTTVTLTFPTLSESLTSLIAPGDSIVVSNANIAAYNGTFTVVTVSATQITYVSGGSASDSLAAPFPTVQLAAGKRIYIPSVDSILYAVIMCKGGAAPNLFCFNGLQTNYASPLLSSSGNTGLTGTVPSPITHGTGTGLVPWAGIS